MEIYDSIACHWFYQDIRVMILLKQVQMTEQTTYIVLFIFLLFSLYQKPTRFYFSCALPFSIMQVGIKQIIDGGNEQIALNIKKKMVLYVGNASLLKAF